MFLAILVLLKIHHNDRILQIEEKTCCFQIRPTVCNLGQVLKYCVYLFITKIWIIMLEHTYTQGNQSGVMFLLFNNYYYKPWLKKASCICIYLVNKILPDILKTSLVIFWVRKLQYFIMGCHNGTYGVSKGNLFMWYFFYQWSSQIICIFVSSQCFYYFLLHIHMSSKYEFYLY